LKRRLLRWVVAICVCAGIGFLVAVWAILPASGITLENAHRVRFGMTADEVESVFGEPCTRTERWKALSRFWAKPDLEVEVIFGPDGCVFAVLYDAGRGTESIDLEPNEGWSERVYRHARRVCRWR
jgi:hypothetical protein